ncbi:PREDICTED: aurora kinase A and ninein-interacting protein-like [Nanorana parkeri]|uniref:aurora kinase A and ninein-interacting protein-like n=1 Tax=Nanorana parkeri TaxID=125878 RepID=UPI0008549A4B|nr:PREDICTED: aurora kinase A and ninein-interacting protein-like [Nanorana parkeri]
MKSKKQRSRCLQPEECGVWLDTADLKKRSYQTVIPCSYSSKFNPPLRSRHFDSATIEFTQTKTPQLCTKQTSMYAFFTPKGKPKPTNQENLPSSLSVKGQAEENDAEPLNVGPLQDRTNVLWDTASPMKRNPRYLSDEDSLPYMFTQDSEGNMVIKH